MLNIMILLLDGKFNRNIMQMLKHNSWNGFFRFFEGIGTSVCTKNFKCLDKAPRGFWRGNSVWSLTIHRDYQLSRLVFWCLVTSSVKCYLFKVGMPTETEHHGHHSFIASWSLNRPLSCSHIVHLEDVDILYHLNRAALVQCVPLTSHYATLFH